MVEFSTGSLFAGHRIEAVAGRGGMGVVYRATQLDLGRTIALKVIAPELAEDSHPRDRFVNESRVAASIDHPNVIPIFDAGEEQGVLFIAMRFVVGTDLRRLVRADGRLALGRAIHVLVQVADAHVRGLVHRDVKPASQGSARRSRPSPAPAPLERCRSAGTAAGPSRSFSAASWRLPRGWASG